MSFSRTFLNGTPATVDDLTPLVFAGFAHFTAMQVRDHAVRGLDLHLDRLRLASNELFGTHLPDQVIRETLATAISAGPPDVSAVCYITPRQGEFTRAVEAPDLDILVKISDRAEPPDGPVDLDVIPHERHLPHIKHVGEVAKTQLLWRANARGFDDAVFADGSGRLTEATIWNLVFSDGRSVIWPEGPMLSGVTMQILQRRFTQRGIPQAIRPIKAHDIDTHLHGAVMNSWTPGIPIGRIGHQHLSEGGHLVALLREAYATEPLVAP